MTPHYRHPHPPGHGLAVVMAVIAGIVALGLALLGAGGAR